MRNFWAIYGLIGTGKSTVSQFFAENNWLCINQDLLGHEVLNENQQEIIALFGNQITSDGSLDRKKLSNYVFSDSNKLAKLMDFSYPKIISKTKELIVADTRNVLVEGALFYKVREHFPDFKLLYIEVERNLLIQRLLQRNHQEDWIYKVLQQQKEIEEHRYLADVILDNSQNLEFLHTQLHELIKL